MKDLMNLPLKALPTIIILIAGFVIDIYLAYQGGVVGIYAMIAFSIKVTGLRNLIAYYSKLLSDKKS